MRRIIGALLVLHGLAHAAAGIWASSLGFGWFSIAVWLVATSNLVGAGLGLLGARGLRTAWRPLAATGALASLLLLFGFMRPDLIPGVLIDVAVILVAWRLPHSPRNAAPAGRTRRILAATANVVAWSFLAHVFLVIAARPWYTTWGTTWGERAAPVPGDSLGPSATYQLDHGVTISAPAHEVWPWLLQMGQDRGGFYSNSWLERLVGADIHNADRIVPEWQHREVGDLVRSAQPGYLGGLFGDDPGWRITEIEPGHFMVLDGWGAFIVEPVGNRTTRLLVRTRGDATPAFTTILLSPLSLFAFEPAHFVMQRAMLLGIKQRAEQSYVTAVRELREERK